MQEKIFKYEGKSFLSKQALFSYIEETKKDELEKLQWEPSRYWFFVKYGKRQGTSVISGKPTEWNNVTERYERFADEAEKKLYVEEFQKRMVKKYGSTHLTDRPEFQKKMLDGRKIMQVYEWKNGDKTNVTGTYEKHFLHFIESVYNFNKKCFSDPPTIFYKDNVETHFYLPDFYVPSLNLIIEIKGGNEHYQNRDKAKEILKQNATEALGFDFLQINDKIYTTFNTYFLNNVLLA